MNAIELQKIKQKYNVVGNNPELNRALDIALQVASTDLSVLIAGESGVGKEIIPRIIHDNSSRKKEKYFAINCGSIPEGTIDSELFGHEKGSFTGALDERQGYFGIANKGTIFLDEAGELPIATQARLLRVLETGEYIRVGGQQILKTDVRIVAATNVNLIKAISEGRFREDLYYRLNTIPIQIPPLRERGEDIILLFRLFAMQMAEKYNIPKITLEEEAKHILLNYKWPGNVRQLKNITEQMSILSTNRQITKDILLQYIPIDIDSKQLVINGNKSSKTYENEREILFKILYELKENVHQIQTEINSLKQQINTNNGGSNDKVLAEKQLPIITNHIKGEETSNYESIEAEEISDIESLNLNDISKQAVEIALKQTKGNRKKAAEELGISDRTLYRKIKEYGLDKK